ncbi:hypothetical protein H2509_18515 [Stappia sp. F7233]|uniref:Uncharacterized protein n=2 Tax=Stappia albiluteola TaxID=2758565 RepID=A0A839AJ81_9HYPH|nr:hypothetical protein [Stappia albiluteola]
MAEWLEALGRFTLTKWAVIVGFAALGAVMQRDMGLWGRALTFAAGVMAAVVFADPVRSLLSLDQGWSEALAAILALTGRNWAAYAIRASRDPAAAAGEILSVWRGRKG